MKNLSVVLAMALSFAAVGCKKKAGGGDCTQAINHSMDLSKADMAKMGVDDKMMQKMKDVGIQRCKEDKWSDDVIKCMTDAKTMTDAQACYGKMPQEQQDKMNKAAAELATPTGAGAGAEAGSAGSAEAAGSAAAGSADAGSGSAAAGSAAAGSAAAGSAAGSADAAGSAAK
jgi:hypothetical protein